MSKADRPLANLRGAVYRTDGTAVVAALSAQDWRDDLDSDRWLAVRNEGSREGYRDMEAFVGTVTDPDRADRLSIAISGRGAFRRFKDVLARWPDELERWYRASNERERGRARAWLAAEGFAAGPASAVHPEP